MVSSITRTQGNIRGLAVAESNHGETALNENLAFSLISLPATPLFGTDGIRGKVGELLNAPLALQIGFWTGVVLRNHAGETRPVILGQDSRNSSDMLAMALSAGLTAAGIEVWYLGLCPTPCVSYLTSMSEAIGGVMISASHNPPEDNGIKVFGADGGKLPQALQAEIEAGLRGKLAVTGGMNCGRHYSRQQLVSDYSQALKQPLQSEGNLQGMKIVLDLAWGAAVGLAPQVFMEMGAEVICLHNAADGDRINVDCGSTHLDILQAAVKEHHADVGFAFDGDADRVLAVDNTGRQVNGDYILYLWGRHLQQQQQLPDNLIVSTVMANLGFERAWEQQGGKLIRTAVGDQYVQAEMLRTGGMLGGEQSGHILCRHYGLTGDGLLTALHIANLVKQTGVSLGELVDQSFQTYPQLLKNVRVVDRDRRLAWQECQPVQDAIALAETAMGDSGRILVRASGTEPVIRVMVEAADAELAQHWTNELVAKVQQHLA
ncbi:phosphoglucosamine mutase [Nostoc spongiaeforme FACHB-130]|uniref:Phosphoglucosamine mutase n=1 Tax=Nostoc spongiaeforme FACHB-130 TaxID=1357510 RepID=A0ABR8G1N3_9NOSO|nr:phosphoglucosamine mutase [Nostoc spongiaeforme]MBD2597143.1 phosphoglucosamine mutase [Nostoc spongiaeforme FACHB-130]